MPGCHPIAVRKTASIAAFVAFLAIFLSCSGAHAVTLDGKWGIGFEETLTGVIDPTDPDRSAIAIPASGLSLRRFVGDLDVELVLGARSVFPSSGTTTWAAFASIGGHYASFRSPRANLSVGLRAIVGAYKPSSTAQNTTTQVGFAFEIPIRAVFFLADQFALSGSVGIVGAIEGKDGNPLTGGKDAVKVSLFRGGFSGGLGFIFLFD